MKMPPPKPSRKQREVLKAAKGEEPTKRLNVNIPASLLKEIKLQAVEEDRAVTEIVKDAIRDYLDTHK